MEKLTTTKKPGMRQRTRTALLALAYALSAYTGIVQLLNLVAGTWITRNADGTQRLGLSSLSIVKFDGIVPSPSKPGSYLVTMHFFLSSFGYEYHADSTAALVSSQPDLPRHFIEIGEKLGAPSTSWDCFRSTGQCTSPFFDSFRFSNYDMPPALPYFTHLYSIIFLILLLTIEALIHLRPSSLQCQCYFPFFKRVCPCPRGSRAEIEALPSTFWDRYRMWMWPMLPVAVFLPAFCLLLNGMLLRNYVNRPSAGNVNAQFGTGFIVLQSTSVAAALMAVLCLYARRLLGQRSSWMEQQGAVAIEALLAQEALREKEYSDAEPEAPLSPAP
ncbi:hypothetical protein CkaCkLH20_11144 [Colletotrichum karsti]|uniref:Transmembrane protein n=1 Tax=Colletotrichum karsti TaxID=1095194 RepID=A0A9P6HUT3_9PEZI|nr:uncharacterized protein CkaCkLH20_11144 [Colletotrichum karsti]KAF9871497.1 hypothetical protein CkaCkLH20_11144 [Colletotrichum karsti]